MKLRDKIQMKKCKYCKSTENLTVDHKVPLIKGGTSKVSNLQCLCRKCNSIKSGLSHNDVMRLFAWMTYVNNSRVAHGKKPYTARKYKIIYEDRNI